MSLYQVFHTEMQRIDGNTQSPLQLARVDESVDPSFDSLADLQKNESLQGALETPVTSVLRREWFDAPLSSFEFFVCLAALPFWPREAGFG